MKQKFNCFVDVATAVTDAVAEEMARSLGRKSVLTTGLPCSFNPGFWDVCWQKDCSWTTPWSVPTLRVLSKLRSGDQIGALDLFAEAKPWTVPDPLLSLKDVTLSTLKAGYMPDNLADGAGWHCRAPWRWTGHWPTT